MHRATSSLLAIIASAGPGVAPVVAQTAQSGQTYVAATVGYAMPKNVRSSVGVAADLGSGIAGTVAVGRGFGAFRGEIEGGYREARVGRATGFGVDVPGTGRVSALSAMANLYFDPAFSIGPVQPYVGGGIGIARFRARDISAIGLPPIPPVTSLGPVSGSEVGLAWQAMAGLALALGNNAALTVGYRYFGTPGVDVSVPVAGTVNVGGLRVHSVDAGVRFAF